MYTSTYLKVDSKVQHPTPTTTNADECFLIIQKLNKQKEKGEYEEGEGGKGVGADFMCLNSHFMEHGQPHV
jgi:hypothetical protein